MLIKPQSNEERLLNSSIVCSIPSPAMSIPLTSLSPEILDLICSFIGLQTEHSFDALSRSCKKLCDISAPHMFRKITVNDINVKEKKESRDEEYISFMADMKDCQRLTFTRSVIKIHLLSVLPFQGTAKLCTYDSVWNTYLTCRSTSER